MSKTLTFDVPEEIYEAFEQIAARSNRTTEEVALEWLARQESKPRPHLTEDQLQAARQRFERHFGAWDSGDPDSADNERIDADLALEYGSTREDNP